MRKWVHQNGEPPEVSVFRGCLSVVKLTLVFPHLSSTLVEKMAASGKTGYRPATIAMFYKSITSIVDGPEDLLGHG